MSVYIVYPEKRWMSDETIISWFKDGIADGMISAEEGKQCHTILDMARLLADVGYITIGNPPDG